MLRLLFFLSLLLFSCCPVQAALELPSVLEREREIEREAVVWHARSARAAVQRHNVDHSASQTNQSETDENQWLAVSRSRSRLSE
mgnify:CR=1 FL=1